MLSLKIMQELKLITEVMTELEMLLAPRHVLRVCVFCNTMST